MSRPPNPVTDLNQPMRGPSLPGRLQQLWRVALEQRNEERPWESDDVQVVALEPLDEAAAETLDGIRAGPPLPLATRDVRAHRLGRERPEGDIGALVGDDVLARAEEAEPRDDRVRPPAELLQHARGVGRVARLAVDPAVEDDRRVDAQRDPAARVNGARLSLRVPSDELLGIRVGRVVLDVVGCDRLERDRELLEDRAPL